MTRIFLSHSSQDNPRAFALAQWLRENGWEDVFLDRIPRQGIAAGEDWKAKIHESMDASAAGIFLISRGWLDSPWCKAEFALAYNLNKLIFGVVVDDLPRDQIPELLKSNWQVADLHGGRDHDSHVARYVNGTSANTTLSRSGLANLKEGLHRAHIAPEYFIWPPEKEPNRAPWRGLSPMERQDAGIFFGRDAQAARALDTIRKLREGNPPRLLAIVGASGAGKSSFLRAGLIPRLRRDDRNYVTLPLIRPEGGALDAFAQSLTEAAAEKCPRALGDIRSMVHTAAKGAVDDLTAFLTELAAAHHLPAFDDQPLPTPTILLPIDQGEELFQSTGRAQGGPFLSLLARLLHHDSPKFLALITIRSDSYEPLQNAPELSGLEHSALSLSAIARGEYGRIITGPVEKLQSAGRKLEFDPAITETLLAEFDKGLGRDALPLLAFTLDRLYRDYQSAGKITQADYLTMGGIAGSIDAAVDRALQSAAQHRDMPTDGPAQHALLRRTMIPWFAGIDPETGTARRNVSHYSQLPPETRPLVDALVEQRLLTRDGDTVEPAHEALLREWQALDTWLAVDREKLITLEALRRAAANWQGKARHKNYLDHRAGRLDEAERLEDRPDLWRQLGPEERAYLVACRAGVTRGTRFRRSVAGVFVVVVAVGVIATAYQARVASQSRVDALALLALSQAETDPISALKLVLGAWPESEFGPFPTPSVAFRAISIALAHTRPHQVIRGSKPVAFSPDGQILASHSSEGTVRLWDGANGLPLGELNDGHDDDVSIFAFSPDGSRIVTGYGWHNSLRLWDLANGIALSEPTRGLEGSSSLSVAFSRDGRKIVSGGSNGTLSVWDAVSGAPLGASLRGHGSTVLSVAFSHDGQLLISAHTDGSIKIWDTINDSEFLDPLEGHQGFVNSIDLSPDGSRIISGGEDGTLRVWDSTNGAPLGEPLRGHEGEINSVAFSRNGNRIVSGSSDGTVRLWDGTTGAEMGRPLRGHLDGVHSVAISSDGNRIASAGVGDSFRLWNAAAGFELGRSLIGHEGRVSSVVLSKDGSRIITGGEDGTVRVWDVPTLTTRGDPMSGPEPGVYAVAISRDGSQIVSGGLDRTLRRWDSETGFPLWEPMTGHETSVSSVGFSPDGKRIVSGDYSGVLRLWDAATGSQKGEPLHKHTSEVHGVAFSPDGTRIISWGLDGARLWNGLNGAEMGELFDGGAGICGFRKFPDSDYGNSRTRISVNPGQ